MQVGIPVSRFTGNGFVLRRGEYCAEQSIVFCAPHRFARRNITLKEPRYPLATKSTPINSHFLHHLFDIRIHNVIPSLPFYRLINFRLSLLKMTYCQEAAIFDSQSQTPYHAPALITYWHCENFIYSP